MTVLYTDIRELVTNDPAHADGDPLGIISDAALVVDGGEIAWVGRRTDAPDADERVSCGDSSVIPGFVDSHSHLVFAGERSAEFAARMSGEPYGAGGIASTVAATRAADDATLLAGVQRLADELLRAGVTTFECKSGYGLTVDDEARSLRIAKAVTDETTFLGAHVVPAEFRDDRAAYIDLITGPMLQACAPHARWVDVFCDRGAFDVDEARHILTAGMAAGLDARLHAGQLGPSAGIRLAVELGAASVDHCTYATDDDVDALAGAADTTVATLLPGAEFSTRAQYPDGRRLIDAGATVALAT
jgi:imidazolonepropionase